MRIGKEKNSVWEAEEVGYLKGRLGTKKRSSLEVTLKGNHPSSPVKVSQNTRWRNYQIWMLIPKQTNNLHSGPISNINITENIIKESVFYYKVMNKWFTKQGSSLHLLLVFSSLDQRGWREGFSCFKQRRLKTLHTRSVRTPTWPETALACVLSTFTRDELSMSCST